MVPSINVQECFAAITEHWSPRVVARVNDQFVKVAKVRGQLAWHKHDGDDEMFYVVRGQLRIQIEGAADTLLNAGEFCVVPRGVMHNPIADEECWIMLIE